MTGSGRIDVNQTYGNLLDGKVSLGFKEGDLGSGDGSLDVKLSQYRFNIYSEYGWTFHYGKYQFLAPSSGIAINETGEGARLAFHNYAVSRIIRRESGKFVADRENRDDALWIFEASNISLTKFFKERGLMQSEDKGPLRFFRTASLVAVRGEDRKSSEEKEDPVTKLKEMVFVGRRYSTYGGQLNFARPPRPGSSGVGAFYGTLSGYWSERDAREKDAPCGNSLHVCDGEGSVGLLTLTSPFKLGDNGKPKGNVTLTLGTGSGDNPTTPTDEGYIGERASFAPDQIFLATFAGAISTRDFVDPKGFEDKLDPVRDRALKEQFRTLDLGVTGLGRGLSNKEYYGVKVVLNNVSPLKYLACIDPDQAGPPWCIIPKSDILSGATFFTFHHYRLRRPLVGTDRDAGYEADVEFNIETPRGVKTNVKGGYYWAGDAVKAFIPKDAWSISVGISLSL